MGFVQLGRLIVALGILSAPLAQASFMGSKGTQCKVSGSLGSLVDSISIFSMEESWQNLSLKKDQKFEFVVLEAQSPSLDDSKMANSFLYSASFEITAEGAKFTYKGQNEKTHVVIIESSGKTGKLELGDGEKSTLSCVQ